MSSVMCPNDEQRILRSIRSVLAKVEISMMLHDNRRNARYFQSEKELEEYCSKHGLIYSPIKYPL